MKFKVAAIIMLASAFGASAIDYDGYAGVRYAVSDKLNITVQTEMRTHDDMYYVFYQAGTVLANYRLRPWLALEAAYSFMETHYYAKHYWTPRQRTWLSAQGQLSIGRLQLLLREQYMYTYRPKDHQNVHMLRSRLMVRYKAGAGFTPYIYCEPHNNIFESFELDHARLEAGTVYTFGRNAIQLYYRYEVSPIATKNGIDYFGIGYIYTI